MLPNYRPLIFRPADIFWGIAVTLGPLPGTPFIPTLTQASSVESTSDEALMAAVRADNLDQLVPLFERYHGPLFNYLTRLTNDRETSQDLTQTVFERIIKYRGSY